MEINKEKVVLAIVGGVVAGFMFGIGYILAERIMKKKKGTSTVSASVSDSEGTPSNFGGYSPQRKMNENRPTPRVHPQHGRPNSSRPQAPEQLHPQMGMPNYMQFNGETPKKINPFEGMDFSTQ